MSGGTGTTVQHHRQAAYDRGYADGYSAHRACIPMWTSTGFVLGAIFAAVVMLGRL